MKSVIFAMPWMGTIYSETNARNVQMKFQDV